MKNIKQKFDRIVTQIGTVMVTDDLFSRILFYFMCTVLSLTSFVMTILNVFTAEYLLMAVTFGFSILCLLNIWLLARHIIRQMPIYLLFCIETFAVLTFFVVTGIPDGFSVLWCTLIPSFALLVFGMVTGSIFSALLFAMVIFLFWIPAGRELLQYNYSSTFMLRYPFLYAASYLLSLVIEYVRNKTKSQLKKTKEEYEYLYRHDALTGLYNRYGIEEFFAKVSQNQTFDLFSVVVFDIDRFKNVNDIYGHTAGDEVLKTVAALTKSVMCEHCDCCRWGGEEFLIVIHCEQDAQDVAEKLRSKIEITPTLYRGAEIRITASFGVYTVKDLQEITFSDLINHADKAMYKAKANGRNRVVTDSQ